MEAKTLSSAIKKIAVSYILIYFNINIGVIDILPDWLGYFIIVSALPILSEEEQSAQLLRPFGIALGIGKIIEWVLKFTNAEWDFTLVSIVFGIITIYFHFQLITNIANLDIEQSKRKRLLVLRTLIVILHTLVCVSLYIPANLFDEEVYTYIIMFMGVTQVILCIWIAGELFGLASTLKQKEAEADEYISNMENAAQQASGEEIERLRELKESAEEKTDTQEKE